MPGIKYDGSTEALAGALLASGLAKMPKMVLSSKPKVAAKQVEKMHSKLPQFASLIENLANLEPKFRPLWNL